MVIESRDIELPQNLPPLGMVNCNRKVSSHVVAAKQRGRNGAPGVSLCPRSYSTTKQPQKSTTVNSDYRATFTYSF